MIGGFVIEGALVGAVGCAVWKGAVRARRWIRDTRRLGRLATYLQNTGAALRGAALNVWKSDDPGLRTTAQRMLDVTAALEAAADGCRRPTWRPGRSKLRQLNELLATSQLIRRTAYDPRLRTADAAALHAIADSMRRTVMLGIAIEPPTRGPSVPLSAGDRAPRTSWEPVPDTAGLRAAALVVHLVTAGLAAAHQAVQSTAEAGVAARPRTAVGERLGTHRGE